MTRTVVVIDDNEPFRSWACDLLAREGYAVIGHAGAGADALRLAEALRPDVLVLDVQLPDMSGFEVLRRLPGGAGATEVVLISARDRDDYGSAVLHSGARAFIGKSELSGRALRAVLDEAS
jgi:DNA-binding NarL/FixJ family response regulator